MPYGSIIAAVIGALAGGGSAAIGANNQPSSPSTGDIAQFLGLESQFKPAGYSAGLNQLSAQSAYGLGADPQQLSLQLLTRQIEQSSNSNVARKFQKYFSNLQSLMLDPNPDEKNLKLRDKYQTAMTAILEKRGGGASVSFGGNGIANIQFANPAQQQLVDRARADYQTIQDRRFTAQNNLSRMAADFPQASATDIQNLTKQYQDQITGEINNTYGQASEDLLQQANTRGYNPAGGIGLLDQQKARDLLGAPTTAASRALQLLGGQQGLALNAIAGTNAALSPDAEIAIMNALRGQQTPTTGQLAAAQIAAGTSTSNQGSQNLTSSLNGVLGLLGQAGGIYGNSAYNTGQTTPDQLQALLRQIQGGGGGSGPAAP